jgi:hypothetical protein
VFERCPCLYSRDSSRSQRAEQHSPRT